MTTIGKRIKQRRKELKMSGDVLAQKVGVIRNTVSRWETDRRIPDITTLKTIADSLETTLAYLIGDTWQERSRHTIDFGSPQTYELIELPIYDMQTIVTADNLQEAIGMKRSVNTIAVSTDIFSAIDAICPPFGVIMPNDSMCGANMNEGDRIIINPSESIRNGDPALVVYNDAAMIRWVCYKADGSIELQAANPNHKTITIEPQYVGDVKIFRIIGRAVCAVVQKQVKQAF